MALPTPSFQSLYDLAKAEIILRDATLNDFRDGSNLDALAGAMAVVGSELARYDLELHKARFLDTANGADLDALGVDRFGLERFDAAKAVGQVYWVEDAASGYAIPAGTTVRGVLDDGTNFDAVTTAAAVSDSGLPIPVQAVTTGRGGNVPAGTLATVVSFATDPNATVTQPERMAGGAPAETDPVYRARLRTYFRSLEKATLTAIQRAVLAVPGISFSSVVEYTTVGALVVKVYVADAEGSGTAALVALAQTAVDATRALGALVVCEAAVREEVALTVTLLLRAGSDYATVLAAVSASIVAYMDSLPAGETVYPSKIAELCHRAHADVVSATMAAALSPTQPYNSLRLTGGVPTLNLA